MADVKENNEAERTDKLESQIKSADMSEDMQQEAIEVAQEAMQKYTIEKEIAHHIKRTVCRSTRNTIYTFSL
ncbi:Dynein light chain [Vermiconidia calcicola]|uniref:Dynein light chain n=1 Tax=Vermiconidia calcicola TaxID=1690605 RepID=A0ACC3NV57_9PEZI|nr:Dynein light chain [Vermiconidia calcicola]